MFDSDRLQLDLGPIKSTVDASGVIYPVDSRPSSQVHQDLERLQNDLRLIAAQVGAANMLAFEEENQGELAYESESGSGMGRDCVLWNADPEGHEHFSEFLESFGCQVRASSLRTRSIDHAHSNYDP